MTLLASTGWGDPSLAPSRAVTPEVVVRVLGPVDVVGAARSFHRAWALELVTYLALHPRGVSADTWTTALFPERPPAATTRHSIVSCARRALGRAADGRDHLPRCDGVLRLSPAVTTDWARLRALAAATGPGAEGSWADALDLVRGRPFEDLRAGDWTILEGFDAAVAEEVVDTASRLACHRLRRRDGPGAAAAARAGLVAAPYDERLYRLLMRAADLVGNPAGVEAAMAELLVQLGAAAPRTRRRAGQPAAPVAPAALEAVHPDTAALYSQLSRRSRHHPSPTASPGGARRGPSPGW